VKLVPGVVQVVKVVRDFKLKT